MAPTKRIKREKVPNNPKQDQAVNNQKIWLFICNHLLLVASLVGCFLSIYAYAVEKSIEQDHSHTAYCDISDRISCTRVFRSQYGKGLGIFQEDSILYQPNSFFGIVYYTIICVFAFSNSPVALYGSLLLIITANIMSSYFAYILYFVLQDLCVVCIGTYTMNAISFIAITKKCKWITVLNELEMQKRQN